MCLAHCQYCLKEKNKRNQRWNWTNAGKEHDESRVDVMDIIAKYSAFFQICQSRRRGEKLFMSWLFPLDNEAENVLSYHRIDRTKHDENCLTLIFLFFFFAEKPSFIVFFFSIEEEKTTDMIIITAFSSTGITVDTSSMSFSLWWICYIYNMILFSLSHARAC